MNNLKIICFASLLVVLLATLGGTPAAGAIPTYAFQCTGGWQIVPSPNPSNLSSALNGVAAVSASDVWAVGATDSQPLIEHWNGAYWQIIPSPGYGLLSGVTALSATDIWAVGSTYGYQTLIEHWDGRQWSISPSPNVGSTNFLKSVAAFSATDIWAVGLYNANNNGYKTLIEHWNGAKWSVSPSPNPHSGYIYLNGVTAVSSQDVWTVGSYSQGKNGPFPLAEHFDGKYWHIAHTPGGYNFLAAVTALDASHIWVVGQYGIYSGTYPLIERWDGSRWHIVPNPTILGGYLLAAASSTNENIWAVGTDGVSTLTEHWDGTGTSWQHIPSPSVPSNQNFLTGVAITSAQTVWAVGYYQPNYQSPTSTLIEYYC